LTNNLYSDALVVLSCCHAGAAKHEVNITAEKDDFNTVEFLMACNADEESFEYGKTFGNALILALKKLSKNSNPVSDTDICQEISKQIRQWKTQHSFAAQNNSLLSMPVHYRVDDKRNRRQILLTSSKSQNSTYLASKKTVEQQSLKSGIPHGTFGGWDIIGSGGVKIPWWLRHYDF
jgi:hypothetical protein